MSQGRRAGKVLPCLKFVIFITQCPNWYSSIDNTLNEVKLPNFCFVGGRRPTATIGKRVVGLVRRPTWGTLR